MSVRRRRAEARRARTDVALLWHPVYPLLM
jgi:hypothetical protein